MLRYMHVGLIDDSRMAACVKYVIAYHQANVVLRIRCFQWSVRQEKCCIHKCLFISISEFVLGVVHLL